MIFFVPVPDTAGVFTVKSSIVGTYAIDSLQKWRIHRVNWKNKGDKKFDINQKLKK